jgi:hypothetical protein
MTNDLNNHKTYKDLVHNRSPTYLSLRGLISPFANILSYGVDLPVIGYFVRCHFQLVCFALSRLRKKGDHIGLYKLLTSTLLGPYFRKKDIYRWWYLMRFGVSVAQERQINWLIHDSVLEDNLILMSSLGPKPWKGYDAAYAFVGYSLWLFERGDIHGAISMIQVAVQADETWGHLEYLHGWYGLFTSDVDSVNHFARAVQIDWSFLQRMKQDRICRQHPELLKEVQRRTLVSK